MPLMSLETRLPTCLVAAMTVAGCAKRADTVVPDAGAVGAPAVVSFADAVAAASAQVPEGVPYEVELETLDGKDVIEVEFLVGATVREAYIDPETGAVITVRDEPPDHTEQTAEDLQARADLVGTAGVSLAEAATIGADHARGVAEEVEFAVVDGTLVADVEVRLPDDTVVTVFVDGVSGEVVDTKAGE